MTGTHEVTIIATGRTIAARITETKVIGIHGDEYAKSEVRLAKTRIIKAGTKHLYCLSISFNGVRGEIDVEANNRDQATRMVERQGFAAHDCNMIG